MAEYLHKRVIFVGDRPSKKNVDPKVPFVGTKSYKTLLEWIYRMDLDINRILTKNSDDLNITFLPEETRFVALGNEGASLLKGLEIKHFKLPHPAKLTEDKQEISRLLYRCKKYIYK